MQATDDKSYTDSQIEFYVILLNVYHRQPDAEKRIKEFVGNNILLRYNAAQSLINSVLSKSLAVNAYQVYIFEFDEYLETLLNHDLAVMWIKSIKYDAFLAKYQMWRNQKSIEKQELLQIEQMFESFDNDLLK